MNDINDKAGIINGKMDVIQLPITTGVFKWSWMGIFLYLLLHVLSLIMPGVMVITFFTIAMDSNFFHWRVYLVFVDVLAWWGSYILCTLTLGKLFLIILSLIHQPREGLFKIDKRDRDYYYFCLRTIIKKFIFWTWNNFCFPWASNLAFKLCDMRADFKSTMFDGWTDVSFIDFGNNMMIGQGALVMSSIILRINNEDFLLVKKTIIGDHCVLGGHSIVSPGTVIGKGTTLGIWSVTHIGQVLEPNWIYIGRPARKYQPTEKALEESKTVRVRRLVDTNERVPYDIKVFKGKGEE
jgi:hypothetical protein